MKTRPEITFAKFTPRKSDIGIGFYPEGGKARGTNRWQQAMSRLAEHAIVTGVERYVVYGGVGRKRWRRVVVVSQADAEAWFEAAIARPEGFLVRRMYERALQRRERRLG